MSTRAIKPPARLEPRNEYERRVSDAQVSGEITYEQLKTVSIFKDVKYERVDLRALPGTIVLRRFSAGEDICVQDEPGYTAFYVMKAEEVAGLDLPPLGPAAVASERVVSVTRAATGG